MSLRVLAWQTGPVSRALATGVLAFALAAPPARANGFAIAFGARSYRPGTTALLHVVGASAGTFRAVVLRAGAGNDDSPTAGQAVERQRAIVHAGGSFELPIRLGAWPSGVYFVRLSEPGGGVRYAPLVLRPRELGDSRVLVVEPTNTWQAYNVYGGDSWYAFASVHVVDLTRPYAGDGLPPHFGGYDRGFLRWYARSGFSADFVSDDDLEQLASGAQLRHLYRLIVFPGHEEYVTAHVYDIVAGFRARGGNLAFLSANGFFYAVARRGNELYGRTRWRDLGRPEAALIGAQYDGWEKGRYPNRPYVVVGLRHAPWLFAGTGLHDGSSFGKYGIEIDETTSASPRDTYVLAEIPNDFGPGLNAEMTVYRDGRATVFDAGAMNFGGSADWPVVSRLVANLWQHLGDERRLAAAVLDRR